MRMPFWAMPFLVAHNCSMEFHQPIIQVDGQKLKCTDRHGRLLISSVQITKELVVPPRTEMAVPCRVTTRNFCPLGVIEGQTNGLIEQAEWGLGPSEFIKRMPQSYAMVCKGQAKSQPESAKSASVLKVTEGLKICSITQTAYPAEEPKCAIPHKEEVEAKARTTIERLLERSQPSKEIHKLMRYEEEKGTAKKRRKY